MLRCRATACWEPYWNQIVCDIPISWYNIPHTMLNKTWHSINSTENAVVMNVIWRRWWLWRRRRPTTSKLQYAVWAWACVCVYFLGELKLLIERVCVYGCTPWCLRVRTLANIMCVGKNIVCHEIFFSSSFATSKITFIGSGVLQPNDFSVWVERRPRVAN